MADLLLLRHAEAASAAGLPDHERPLTGRGRSDAEALGARLRAAGAPVDVAVVSSAVRARQTHAALALPEHDLHVDRGLYAAELDDVLDVVGALGETARGVLVVGHNPTLQGLARWLVRPADAAALERFPPATLAWLRLSDGTGDLRARSAGLHAVHLPR